MCPIPVYTCGACSDSATRGTAVPAFPAKYSPRLGVVGRIIELGETRESRPAPERRVGGAGGRTIVAGLLIDCDANHAGYAAGPRIEGLGELPPLLGRDNFL